MTLGGLWRVFHRESQDNPAYKAAADSFDSDAPNLAVGNSKWRLAAFPGGDAVGGIAGADSGFGAPADGLATAIGGTPLGGKRATPRLRKPTTRPTTPQFRKSRRDDPHTLETAVPNRMALSRPTYRTKDRCILPRAATTIKALAVDPTTAHAWKTLLDDETARHLRSRLFRSPPQPLLHSRSWGGDWQNVEWLRP